VFLFTDLVECRYLLLEGLRHRVLLPGVDAQAHEREEAVRLSVFGFAVDEAGKPSKPLPVRRAGVSVVSLGQCLGGKGSEELRKHRPVFQPGLKVAGAGLDDGARVALLPLMTVRPNWFHAYIPATRVASGFCRAISRMFPKRLRETPCARQGRCP
jgi:hypothetical protein